MVPGQEGGNLTTAMLAAAAPEQQKQMLGERLFPQVQRLQPELAGKITGEHILLSFLCLPSPLQVIAGADSESSATFLFPLSL